MRTRAGAAAALTVAALSSCSAGAEADRAPTPVRTESYAGPWAQTFADWAELTDVEFGLEAFRDSRLTEAEYEQGMLMIRECYASRGYEVEYDRYGFETVTSIGGTEDAFEVMGDCAFADGGVVALYSMIMVNPRNDDMLALAAACLLREELVEPGFSRDYVELMPVVPGSAEERCIRDPQGRVSP